MFNSNLLIINPLVSSAADDFTIICTLLIKEYMLKNDLGGGTHVSASRKLISKQDKVTDM